MEELAVSFRFVPSFVQERGECGDGGHDLQPVFSEHPLAGVCCHLPVDGFWNLKACPLPAAALSPAVMVGIRAASSDHGYRMFEVVNDRGARLTAVDLLKSYLLSHVGEDEDQFNAWHEMLRELATDREDSTAASRFIKAFLLARCAREGHDDDCLRIDSNLNCGSATTPFTWAWCPNGPTASCTSRRTC
ncbi:hypothetical protein [Streptomyces sp. NPDC048419]|uniref:hypothetical protein n=1 Tax=Streptomyces sp. NPDC048419 TaxID=3365547 RepID=UPI003710FF9A